MELPYYYQPHPPLDLDAATTEAFERIYAEQVEHGTGEEIRYDVDAPRWKFLCYIADNKDVVLHGSGNPNIEEFEPRQSNDIDEFGNRKAVYAASDGIWPMYFAIVNRDGPVRALANACFRVINPDQTRSEPYYFFSINDDALGREDTWRNGTVYILPRASFEQQGHREKGDAVFEIEQWASLVAVGPSAKLSIQPDDFPFLSQVRGHNVAVIIERAARDPDGFPWLED